MVVPEGAISGDVTVCVASLCSEGVPFTVTIEPAAVNFVDITSLAYEEGTGSLWIGDRGDPAVAGDSIVYEIDSTGAIFVREGNFNQPFISNPSVEDGSGRIYYSNGLVSNFNSGTIKFIRSADNTIGGFRDAGEAVDDPVWARGMVASPHELDPPTCYFLDGNNNTIRREPRLGLEDPNWGNFTFNFNDPAGGRFDSAGNLYVTSTTEVYKIAPDETISLVASGFTAAAGMDLIEINEEILLAVADEGSDEVVLVKALTGDKVTLADNIASPVAVTFSEPAGSADRSMVVATSTQLRLLPYPFIEFDLCGLGDCKILLSKVGNEDSYPSPRQSEDAKIEIGARTLPGVDTVYFRLRDPADPSPYLTGSENDNLPTAPAGSLSPTEATPDEDGRVTTTLTVDPDHSGNNYIVEASIRPHSEFTVAAESPVYATWRRVYYEHDRMFKEGAWITQDSGAGQPDPTIVYVDDPSVFNEGDQVHVISAQDAQTRVGEGAFVAIGGIQSDHIVLNAPLSYLYAVRQPFPNDSFPFSFVGRVAGGSWDVQPTAERLRETYDDAFTEWVPAGEGSGLIPAWLHLEGEIDDLDARTTAYFDHYSGTWPTGAVDRNIVQLMSARQFEATAPFTGYGRTRRPTNWSAVFVQTINDTDPGGGGEFLEELARHLTMNHELAHQFNVNPPHSTTEGHDTETAWNDPMTNCLMWNPLDVLNQFFQLHAAPSAPSQDLLCIRNHVDDLNDDACPPFAP